MRLEGATRMVQLLNIGSVLTTEGRAAKPFRVRVGAAFATIGALHVVGVALLAYGVLHGGAGALGIGVAAFAYLRGLSHAFDFDHISMIDNSTRMFVTAGRRPASVGLAFSAGHSTVVILTGVLVVTGAAFVRDALNAGSDTAQLLGVIGLSVSGLYLLLVATTNAAAFGAAWKLRAGLRRDPGMTVPPHALTPQGPAARLLTVPLRRVRHPRHIYLIGLLFSLGFDTSSQIGLMIVTGAAALAGAPPVSLLALPFLFTAAMTLGDTSNGLMMLKMYEAAAKDPARKVTFNLVVTGISLLSGLTVALIAAATLLTEQVGLRVGLLEWLASFDTTYVGYLLVGLFALLGLTALIIWRRSRAKGPG